MMTDKFYVFDFILYVSDNSYGHVEMGQLT